MDTVVDAAADPIVALFKVGAREHMLELLEEGHLYLNTLGYFKALNDESPRSDPDEATAFAWQTHGYTLDVGIGDDWTRVGTIDGATRFHDKELENANLYCLYAKRRSQCSEPWSMAAQPRKGSTRILQLLKRWAGLEPPTRSECVAGVGQRRFEWPIRWMKRPLKAALLPSAHTSPVGDSRIFEQPWNE